jgi:hypothetical protein
MVEKVEHPSRRTTRLARAAADPFAEISDTRPTRRLFRGPRKNSRKTTSRKKLAREEAKTRRDAERARQRNKAASARGHTAGPGRSGWVGPGRGTDTVVKAMPEFRGNTNHVCGLWPFAAGTGGTPQIGTPVGRRLTRNGLFGRTVCFDPISWFRHRLISNPSAFMLALPGLGKTTVVERMASVGYGFGFIPLILGDVRPDYVEMVKKLDGQVITLGDGQHFLNVLDPGELPKAIRKILAAAEIALAGGEKDRAFQLHGYAAELQGDFLQRRQSMVYALVEISRGARVKSVEKNIIAAALDVLDETMTGVPILGDLLEVIRNPPASVRRVAIDRGDYTRYQKKTEALEEDLTGLVEGGVLGLTFSKHTSTPMVRNRPVVYDISSIAPTNRPLLAAALMACWSDGFATVNAATVLADAGLEPRRYYFLVLDELHRTLQAGGGVIDYLDLITRLNRSWMVGQIMITHTMKDLVSLLLESDRQRAKGFVERAGAVLLGGLPPSEMDLLAEVITLSEDEKSMITSWSAAGSVDDTTGEETPPPGRGNFLIKVGHKPGIAFHLDRTTPEVEFNQSSSKWNEDSRIGSLEEDAA